MPDELVDEEHGDAVAALHHVIRSEEWNYLSGTGAAARGRSRRMRRARYAATAGSAVAVTGVAVLVASTFGGSGGSTAATAAPTGAAPHHTSAAQAAPHIPAKTTESQPTMGTAYYDKWKSCPVDELTVGPDPGGHAPSTSTKVWVDACQRMVAALSAQYPGADVSPAPNGWHVPSVHSMPPRTYPGRNDPLPAHATPTVGPSMYRIEDAKGTIVFAFHAGSYESGQPAGSVSVPMVDGLRAWVAPPKPDDRGTLGLGEFYVTDAAKRQQAYALLMSAPPTFTAEDFQALVTNPTFEQMMAGNLAEPNF
jgi:hypothetical protein